MLIGFANNFKIAYFKAGDNLSPAFLKLYFYLFTVGAVAAFLRFLFIFIVFIRQPQSSFCEARSFFTYFFSATTRMTFD